jgi:hypothetical protein
MPGMASASHVMLRLTSTCCEHLLEVKPQRLAIDACGAGAACCLCLLERPCLPLGLVHSPSGLPPSPTPHLPQPGPPHVCL